MKQDLDGFHLAKQEVLKNQALERIFPWSVAHNFVIPLLNIYKPQLAEQLDWWFYRGGFNTLPLMVSYNKGGYINVTNETDFLTYLENEQF
jgi:hypothetical protein